MAHHQQNLTRNQQLVAGVLAKSDHPQSAYDILDKLRTKGLKAPLQVYRALEKLIDLQLVHKLESLNSFVSCRHSACHGGGVSAFIICQMCGMVAEFDAADSVATLQQRAKGQGFHVSNTVIEIKGTCRQCA